MKKIQTFIFVHDQQIVLDFEANNKFSEFSGFQYVFLGDRPTEKVRNLSNIIFARDYEDNIEDFNKNLLAFSGWYLLWKNNLIEGDFINLFEYDIILHPDFEKIQNEAVQTKDPSFMGYQLINIKDYWYIGDRSCSEALIKSIKKNYDVDYYGLINSLSPELNVTITSNHSFSKTHFEEYMKWMEPMIDDFKTERMAGHMPERSVSMYYVIKQIGNVYCDPNILTHYRLDSHQTQSQPKYYVDESYNKIIKNKI